MPTKDWMRTDPAVDRFDRTPLEHRDQRNWLEVALAALGFAAWVWCAFEVLHSFMV
ncbi:MAG: hypothetical protein ACYC8V_01490 [Caulobacteraceae bacterium]